MKVREILRLIEDDGWYLVATVGSHRQYKHPIKVGRVTVPGKLGKDLPLGTEQTSCPRHSACFDLRTGEAVSGPAVTRLPCFAVRVEPGRVWIRPG